MFVVNLCCIIFQERDDDERIGLHWAASSKNTELVQYLLSLNGIQVNCQDDVSFSSLYHWQAGTTPLMCAVSAGRIDNVVLLLDAGADVNLENENKETVLHMTRSCGMQIGLVQITLIFFVSLLIKLLISIRRYVLSFLFIQNDYGLTALMKAASLGCLDSITVLLDHGADMYACDMEGNTAAHYAAFDNQREAYLLLKRRGLFCCLHSVQDLMRTL